VHVLVLKLSDNISNISKIYPSPPPDCSAHRLITKHRTVLAVYDMRNDEHDYACMTSCSVENERETDMIFNIQSIKQMLVNYRYRIALERVKRGCN